MSFDLIGLVLQAGLVVKLVLVLLLAFSAISWAIIAGKWRELRRALQDSEAFLQIYHEEGFDAARKAARKLTRSPMASVFAATSSEISRVARQAGRAALREFSEEELRRVGKRIKWSRAASAHQLERGLPFLATTGSSAPFIGLFGTVVGIIETFQRIGVTQSASLAVVGPGMAEALIATGVGLFAAIPATVFYNLFAGRIDEIDSSLDLFADELKGDLVQMSRRPARGETTGLDALGGSVAFEDSADAAGLAGQRQPRGPADRATEG